MQEQQAGGGALRANSVGSHESYDTENEEGLNVEQRERLLAESTVDTQDADLSLAFANIRDRVADNTWVHRIRYTCP